MRTLPVEIPRSRLADFCRRNKIRKLSVFGSVLRDDFAADSDLDVLVEFSPGHVPGLSFFLIQDELSLLVGRKVDLNTVGDLSTYFRDDVLREAEALYVEA